MLHRGRLHKNRPQRPEGIAQPEAVISAVRVFYNWLPMILSIILFVAFVTTFRLERDLKRLRTGQD